VRHDYDVDEQIIIKKERNKLSINDRMKGEKYGEISA